MSNGTCVESLSTPLQGNTPRGTNFGKGDIQDKSREFFIGKYRIMEVTGLADEREAEREPQSL